MYTHVYMYMYMYMYTCMYIYIYIYICYSSTQGGLRYITGGARRRGAGAGGPRAKRKLGTIRRAI